MKYCPKCKSMMMPRDGKMVCMKCGYTEEIGETTKISIDSSEKDIVIVDSEEELATLPTVKIECPVCGNTTAYWRMEQTRAADEPTTRIYTCTKCNHVWREY